jgi:hypothetical protein
MGVEKQESFTDRVGREVSVGDEIVYTCRAGSGLWLTEATVLGIEYVRDEDYPWRNGLRIRVTPAEGQGESSRVRVLRHPQYIVKVRSAEEIALVIRKAELEATPQRIVIGNPDPAVSVGAGERIKAEIQKPGRFARNTITFGSRFYG